MSIVSDIEDALAGACDELHEEAVREALSFLHANRTGDVTRLAVVPPRASPA